MPETIPAHYDPNDLPDWARKHRAVRILCASNLGFRANVYTADHTDYRAALIREAERWLDLVENS